MSEPGTHLLAVCPKCETHLRVSRDFLGQQLRCKRCNHKFTVGEMIQPMTPGTGEYVAPAIKPPSPDDRIVVVCPGCQSSLRVRRVYIGHHVRCKQCEHTFLVASPPKPTVTVLQ